MTGIIYKFTNKIDGKVYIGQTINEYRRYYTHKNADGNSYFHDKIREVGFENFEYEVIFKDEFDNKNDAKIVLDDRERQAILDYMSWNPDFGYNKSLGVGATGVKWKQSEEQKLAQSKRHKGKNISNATRTKISNANKGKDTWNNGKKLSDTHKQLIAKGLTRHKNVYQYDHDGNLIGTYDNIIDAVKHTGCSYASIWRQLNDKISRINKNNFIWKIKIE